MNFSQRLKKVMTERNITQAELSAMTGIGRSGISQYLSGKNRPGFKALTALAGALGVSEAWLTDDNEEAEAMDSGVFKIPVATAAKLMGVGKQFIRVGLQAGKLPFGYAVNISGKRFTYYISPEKFTEYTGIEVTDDETGEDEDKDVANRDTLGGFFKGRKSRPLNRL